jgi:hypothetical protein
MKFFPQALTFVAVLLKLSSAWIIPLTMRSNCLLVKMFLRTPKATEADLMRYSTSAFEVT